MSMLKSSVAKAVAAVIAATAGTTAFAASTPNDGPSDLFIAVWNPTTSTSYVQDLGSTFDFNDLWNSNGTFNTAGFTTSVTLDGGNLTTALGGSGTYSFSLFAGQLTVASSAFNNYLGDQGILSETAGHAITPLANSQAFTQGIGRVATYLDTNMGCPGGPGPGACTSPGNQSFTAVDNGQASSLYWASATNPTAPGSPGNDFQIPVYPGHAVGTQGLELVKYFAPTTGNDAGTDPTVSSFVGAGGVAGTFTLNDANGVLSYSQAGTAPVPLPAAAWLLVSGLLGLGAVGRRKAKATAA